MPEAAVIKKIQTLAQITAALGGGDHFNITRLTILKSLCADPKAAAKFALYIAKLAQKRTKPAKSTKQQGYRRLIPASVRAMATYHAQTGNAALNTASDSTL